jgi:four helix bundle protein
MSVPANLAEGSGRGSDRDFARFVRIARGSASELQSLIDSACEVGLLRADVAADLDRQVDMVGKMLSALARRLATSS